MWKAESISTVLNKVTAREKEQPHVDKRTLFSFLGH